jgi:hypothetical protein
MFKVGIITDEGGYSNLGCKCTKKMEKRSIRSDEKTKSLLTWLHFL